NSVNFDYAPVLPRGKLMKFVPTQSGVYKFEGNNGGTETDCWLGQGENNRQIAENDKEIRRYYISNNMDYELYHWLEAGQTYYITSAFYDVLQTGRLRFKISYVGESAEYIKLCSPGYEVGTTGPDGELDGGSYIIQVNTRLAEDGFYHSVNRDGSLGDYIYAEWKYLTDSMNISLSGAIDKGGFNFGAGNDKTEIARSYNSKMITSGDKEGLVPVDKQLHDLLVEYMDFHGGGPGKQTWQRLCYYVVKVGK
ncbi:MAG: hypothetical protein MJ238_02350, partial [Bacilli bacterium]|nr:hypothetical protein [Bacilli bacterium]